MFGMQMGKMGGVGQMTLAQRIAYMFANSEPGAWYDPSDLTTLFQDSAGTTPVTAVEQPVGLMLEKSGRGNHATQATTTKRPVYSRRVNLLTKTDDFSAGAWVKRGNLSVTPDYMSVGVTRISSIGTPGVDDIFQLLPSSITDYSFGLLMQQDPLCTTGTISLRNPYGSAGGEVHINLALLPTTLTYITYAHPAVTVINRLNQVGGGIGLMLQRLSGTSPLSILIKGTQIEPGLIAGPYQRVNTAADYDTVGFPAYLLFDGVDDALGTTAVDFTGTDKMTVWAGVTKLSDAAFADIVNTGIISAAPGFYLGSSAGGQNFVSRGRGSVLGATTTASGYTAPNTSILTGIFDISGSKSNLRVNGALTTNSSSLGTGNFSNSPMYIGASNGTSDYFNGRLYSLIVRGAQSSQSQIEATELYIKQKMRLP